MPAAAVIPAPIAYINVVVFKKLVVGTRLPRSSRLRRKLGPCKERKTNDLKRPFDLGSDLL